MGEKSRSPSFYIVNVAGLLLVLSVIGSTLRFTVISVTLISWLQTQWLSYTSALQRRHSRRLAAAADENRTRRRKQVAEISEAVGQNVISLLDKRRRELVLRLDQEAERRRQSYRRDIVTRITDDLVQFQEGERIKDEQRLTLREYKICQRQKEIKDTEEALLSRQKTLDDLERRIQSSEGELQLRQRRLDLQEQKAKDRKQALKARQKELDEREQRAKAVEEEARRMHLKQEETKIQRRVVTRPATVATRFPENSFSPPASVNKAITLPANLLEFADDLNSYPFRCIGVAKTGTRCGQSMISNYAKSAASARIKEMTSPGPGDVALFEMKALRELADWMLCPRWHRDKHPQGAGIASRWYSQLSDARAQLETQAMSSYKTPPSAGAPNIFGSASSTGISTGTTASSFGSSTQSAASPTFHERWDSQSMSFRLERTTTTTSAFGQQKFEGSAAKNLTSVFEFMSQESAVTKKGFDQW
ncbi:hypothetical protein TMatcc_001768 [Talaromyces marneffei ATCC 18224]|uniref:Uncharacterized protein n=2 Tax=Talaromyces marneffei TaxID=37727 RepID=B6QHQ9_TALMQ|nr:uncharacterized protein EYB26_007033 [Talaromyces marneffei]EEA22904.1 hypothetical protein PMAA_095090 [Talaromyces marneffei ATCC 18224]KAE8551783.1 hypothetical protein EYB25_005673 [Talaromyces marneffei]QGA19344.1 hypothetical protein EYB26_007033 [Talaromyces marneffei]